MDINYLLDEIIGAIFLLILCHCRLYLVPLKSPKKTFIFDFLHNSKYQNASLMNVNKGSYEI